MKKIKFLHAIIITLIILLIARSVFMILNIPPGLIKNILINIPILLLLGLFYIERGLFYSIKKGYFNTKSSAKFKRGGQFLIFSGLVILAQNIILLSVQFNTLEIQGIISQNISQSLLVLIVGLGLIIISDYIKKGNQIQQENELTI